MTTPEGTRVLNSANAERRAVKLRQQIQRKHDWRIEVWATGEQKIEEMQMELASLGFARENLIQPDFTDPAMVEFYAKKPGQ